MLFSITSRKYQCTMGDVWRKFSNCENLPNLFLEYGDQRSKKSCDLLHESASIKPFCVKSVEGSGRLTPALSQNF